MQISTLGKILIIDDDEGVLFAAKMLLKKYAESIIIESNPNKIPFLVTNHLFDIVLLDMNFSNDITSGKEGFYWLKEILKINPKAVVIMITAFGDVEMAVQALKLGATDFVLKPWHNEKLIATISSAFKLSRSYREVDELVQINKSLSNQLNEPFPEMIGSSKAMKQVFATIKKVAKTDANILVLGENGTGKELIAKALHHQSERANKPFIHVDMGALSETLFESELFGHKKGAFTDAKEDRIGRFEIANQGTLFLDEIGNLSMSMQAKLLTAIQKKEIIRLGTNTSIPIDIRLICATNITTIELNDSVKFRQDLLYRINTVEIILPPLRDRKEDIPLLVTYFIASYSRKYRKPNVKISKEALEMLQNYVWFGNIREMEHAIERTVIMSDKEELNKDDFFFLEQKPEQNTSILNKSFNLELMEKSMIEKVIDSHAGNISKAAKELGLTRAALYRRLEKYGI
ncbi:MAG: sigma-54-dependent Fis family transcriptional regulator [Cytophagales bacterium]|nr:MAG: sigma-54-dependent Fis family transcriptional regulator [Cytophagales bacterium]